MRIRRELLLGVVIGLAGAVEVSRAEVRIVAHPAVAVSEVDPDEVRLAFLGHRVEAEGVTLIPAVLKRGSAHEQFTRDFLGRTPEQFSTYWRRQLFSGKGVPPRVFESETDLLEFVRATPGAVAYVDSASSCDGVQVLRAER